MIAETVWVHTHKCALQSSPAEVFAALTDPAQLQRWFADQVDIDARAGGAFRFWGKHTYGAPTAPDAQQRLTRFERDRALSFRWLFHELDSEVAIELAPVQSDAGKTGTQLTLEHRLPSALPSDHGAELVDDLWKLTMGNLDAHLRGGEGIVLPDYSDASPEVRVSMVIDAPRARVFDALVNPASLNKWIASAAVVEPFVGGRYSYGWQYTIGERDVQGGPTEILDLVENERLVTDWPDWRGDPTKPRVTVVHGAFPRVVDIGDYPFGWGEFLTQLKRVVETE